MNIEDGINKNINNNFNNTINIFNNTNNYNINNNNKKHYKYLLNYIKMNLPLEDINKPNKNGNYILPWACANDNLDIFTYLVENGANINIVGANGYTPLHFAYANGHLMIIDLLEKKGANQYAKDNDGREPWQHFALYLLGGSLDCF